MIFNLFRILIKRDLIRIYRSRYMYANVYHSMVVTQILYHVELAAYDCVTVNGSDSFLYIQVLHLRFMLLFFLALLASFFLFEAQSCGFLFMF